MAESDTSRRAFVKEVAFGLGLSGLATMAPADDDGKQPTPADKKEEKTPLEIYYLGAVLRQYPDERLDEVAVHSILRDITGDTARGRVLSRFPLSNSDAPDPAFRAWRRV